MGMIFFNIEALSWLDVLKNIVLHLLVTISVAVYVGLVYAYLNGKRDSLTE